MTDHGNNQQLQATNNKKCRLNIRNPTCHNKHPSTWRGETRVLTSFTARFPEILQLVQLLLVKNSAYFLPRPIKKYVRNTIKVILACDQKIIKLCKCNQKFSINLKTTSVSTKKTHLPKVFGQFLVNKDFVENMSSTIVLLCVKASKTRRKKKTTLNPNKNPSSPAGSWGFLQKMCGRNPWLYTCFLVVQLFHLTTLGPALQS